MTIDQRHTLERNKLYLPVVDLIEKYKADLRHNGLKDELYKWRLLQTYRGRPNLDVEDFTTEVKSIDFSNLIYGVGIGVVHHLAKDRPEEYRACYKVLFNEELPLAKRLHYFTSETLKLFRELQPNPKHSHHHDERTMATLLTYYNPDKYAFYKDSFYQKYCKLLGIKPKKVGVKYLHYLELLDSFIDEFVEPDTELLDLVNGLLPADAFEDRNHKLLAQDILYRMLEGQSNNQGLEDPSFQKDEKELKQLINKLSAENLNVYFHTLDRLIEDLGIEDGYKLAFSTSGKLSFQVGIRFCLNLERNQFYFIAPEEYEIKGIEKGQFEGITKPSFFHKASASVILEHYPAMREAVQFELETDKYTDKKKYDNAAFRKAAFDKEYRTTLFDFQEIAPMAVDLKVSQNAKQTIPLNQILFGPPGTGKTYNTINKALEILGEQVQGIDRTILKKKFEDKVAAGQIMFATFHQSMSYEDFIEGIKPIEPDKEGDPVIYKVVEGIFKRLCIEASFSLATKNESVETENVLDFSLAFDTFVQQLEERLATETAVELDIKHGGKVLVDSISPQGNILIKHHGGSRTYTVSKPRLSKLQKSIFDLDEVNNINNHFRNIIGGNNSSAYWAVLNAIRKDGSQIKSKPEERSYTWEEKIEVVQSLKHEDYKKNQGEPFVLIIDEINRGNVSQIFGELITLIEDDKRLGKTEQLEVYLPYSKEKFGVPANLYIIGTMNTADRSVEALDTALRRRFSFVEMPPRYDLKELQHEVNGYKLANVLFKINRRIERLLGKDNLIGHSYFLCVENTEDLRKAFQNKILPLLQEYFFGDYGKIGLVLGEGFFEVADENEQDNFAAFRSYDTGGLAEKEVYHLVDLIGENRITDEAFQAALDALMH